MTGGPSRVVLDRLRAVEWSNRDGAHDHAGSRAALMRERGGGFHVGEYIDLDGISVPLGRLSDHLSDTPVVALDAVALDALDTSATADTGR
ncbi:hypothetical protein ACFVHB_36960 [Kitasatospora sp. NPDC127111]|uniref:hypothetical protein n=1 Tax=Kitasatospora sp. NPDC127111 TaxID=3345363 RepID=UPI00363E36FA